MQTDNICFKSIIRIHQKAVSTFLKIRTYFGHLVKGPVTVSIKV